MAQPTPPRLCAGSTITSSMLKACSAYILPHTAVRLISITHSEVRDRLLKGEYDNARTQTQPLRLSRPKAHIFLSPLPKRSVLPTSPPACADLDSDPPRGDRHHPRADTHRRTTPAPPATWRRAPPPGSPYFYRRRLQRSRARIRLHRTRGSWPAAGTDGAGGERQDCE